MATLWPRNSGGLVSALVRLLVSLVHGPWHLKPRPRSIQRSFGRGAAIASRHVSQSQLQQCDCPFAQASVNDVARFPAGYTSDRCTACVGAVEASTQAWQRHESQPAWDRSSQAIVRFRRKCHIKNVVIGQYKYDKNNSPIECLVAYRGIMRLARDTTRLNPTLASWCL